MIMIPTVVKVDDAPFKLVVKDLCVCVCGLYCAYVMGVTLVTNSSAPPSSRYNPAPPPPTPFHDISLVTGLRKSFLVVVFFFILSR